MSTDEHTKHKFNATRGIQPRTETYTQSRRKRMECGEFLSGIKFILSWAPDRFTGKILCQHCPDETHRYRKVYILYIPYASE